MRLKMLGVEACTCSLQARLHQVENARNREMKAHGELVKKFEGELETRCTSEAELRLTVAKLRADKCRLEAELTAAHTKVRQLLKQLDAQSIEISKCEDTFKAFREESDRQLRAAHEKSANLMEEKRQLSFQLSESRTCLENAKHENKLLCATNAEQSLRANTQAAEVERLSTQLATKQQEIEAAAVRTQLALNDLTRSRDQQDLLHGQIHQLQREINHALVTRNRAINWRRKRHETWENRFVLHSAFLAWTANSVQMKLQTAAKVARCNNDIRARLQLTKDEVMKCCSQVKAELSKIRQECVTERKQLLSLREEIIQTELPKLQTLLEKHRRSFDQLERLELQRKNQLKSAEKDRERLGMALQEAQQRVQAWVEAHQAWFTHQKQQQRSIVQVFAAKRRREFHQRTFSTWKELYLRSVVGQATHTAMVYQAQQSQLPTLEISSRVERRESQSWAMPASIRPTPRIVQRLQREKQSFDDCLRSPMSEPATPIEAMWRKWRRVDGRSAGRGLGYRSSSIQSSSQTFKA